MILLGRVYEGLMVDVQAVNQKLVRRSEDMLIRLTGCSCDAACDALKRARGSVKLAVLPLHGCDLDKAVHLIEQAEGHLRAALAMMQKRGSGAA